MIHYLIACGLTVLIETGFFLLLGWRERDQIAAVVCANVVSNLLLNLCLYLWIPFNVWTVTLGELLVVAFEYAVFASPSADATFAMNGAAAVSLFLARIVAPSASRVCLL